MPTVETSSQLNCSAKQLRDYLGCTANIPEISDPELELEVLNADETVTESGIIEFRISAYGFKQRIQHRYTEVSDQRIVAEQVDGPTRAWKHIQQIVSTDDGCQLTDTIEFEAPGGMLGFVMTAAKIEESIRDGMEHRYETLNDVLGDS